MKLDHTPGIWRNGYGDGVTGPTTPNVDGPTCAGELWEHTIVASGKETIAIIPIQENGVMEANARLIAAAPEMLDALIKAYKTYSRLYYGIVLDDCKKIIERAIGKSIDEVLK